MKNQTVLISLILSVLTTLSCLGAEQSNSSKLQGKWIFNSKASILKFVEINDIPIERISEVQKGYSDLEGSLVITFTKDKMTAVFDKFDEPQVQSYKILDQKADKLTFETEENDIMDVTFLTLHKIYISPRGGFGLPMVLNKETKPLQGDTNIDEAVLKKLSGTWEIDCEASTLRNKLVYDGELKNADENDSKWESMTFSNGKMILIPKGHGQKFTQRYGVREAVNNHVIIKPDYDGISRITFLAEDKIELVGDGMIDVLNRKK